MRSTTYFIKFALSVFFLFNFVQNSITSVAFRESAKGGKHKLQIKNGKDSFLNFYSGLTDDPTKSCKIGTKKVEYFIIVDESMSIGIRNWVEHMLPAVTKIVKFLRDSTPRIPFTMIKFSNISYLFIRKEDSLILSDRVLINKVSRMGFRNGPGTYTGNAVEIVKRKIDEQKKRNEGVYNRVILMTDGLPNAIPQTTKLKKIYKEMFKDKKFKGYLVLIGGAYLVQTRDKNCLDFAYAATHCHRDDIIDKIKCPQFILSEFQTIVKDISNIINLACDNDKIEPESIEGLPHKPNNAENVKILEQHQLGKVRNVKEPTPPPILENSKMRIPPEPIGTLNVRKVNEPGPTPPPIVEKSSKLILPVSIQPHKVRKVKEPDPTPPPPVENSTKLIPPPEPALLHTVEKSTEPIPPEPIDLHIMEKETEVEPIPPHKVEKSTQSIPIRPTDPHSVEVEKEAELIPPHKVEKSTEPIPPEAAFVGTDDSPIAEKSTQSNVLREESVSLPPTKPTASQIVGPQPTTEQSPFKSEPGKKIDQESKVEAMSPVPISLGVAGAVVLLMAAIPLYYYYSNTTKQIPLDQVNEDYYEDENSDFELEKEQFMFADEEQFA